MMTGEVLTLIVIIPGTTAGIITVAMKRENSTTGTAGGIEGGCRLAMVHGPSEMKGWNGRLIPSIDDHR